MSDSILGQLGQIPPAAALGGLGLGYMALKGNQPPAGYNQLSQIAYGLGQTGQSLTAAGLGGPLPVGAQEALASAEQANRANVRQQYANMGLSGSTMESQAQQFVSDQRAALEFQVRQTLLTEGMKATGMSAQDLAQLIDVSNKETQAFGAALTGFAKSFAGGL